MLLVAELVLVEIPTTVVSTVVANAPGIRFLLVVTNYFIMIEVIFYTVTCMTMSAVYLYSAWSKSKLVEVLLNH
jgi:hypothetical protein